MHYDIFNGDADGICALHQLRLADPRPDATRISGVKRDIVLLGRPELASICDATLTVLDVSLDSNREPLLQLLARNNTITYFDHHSADPIPKTDLLTASIVLSADTCTSLLVNEALKGKYARWAICGAFGDNLHTKARKIAASCSLSETETDQLREIGELLNYNGYGATIDDLHFHPLELYDAVVPFANPLLFFQESSELVQLRKGFQEDMELALAVAEYPNKGKNRVYFFPDAPWGRRVAGVFANLKAREKADSAHALITENRDGTLRISVRAPLNDRRDAATLCKKFPSGGGRAASAGINYMPADQIEDFLAAFNTIYP
ncbi:DHH family phosphoesterase [Desulfopila aestuarii]|nr:DHH family phosphoesterase [Desulfopila aestuarii]